RKPPAGISSTNCDHFQVLCVNDCQLFTCEIMRRPQCFEFFTELSRLSLTQRSEGAIGGSIVLTKELQDFSRRERVGEVVLPSLHLEIRDAVAQPIAHYSPIAPQHRSWHA